ncbi:hypothetical protein GBA52_025085 [Prunus armeniaca]|nr:hypothetical protein GBA52_025085 [Prunus armeniaca]
MTGDIQEQMRSHQVEKLHKKKVVQKVNSKAGIYDAFGSRFNILENDCFDGEQEHVFGTLENLLSINGKAIQSKDDGGWNDLTPPNKDKKKLDQALINLRRLVTRLENGGLEIGEVDARRDDYSFTFKPQAPNIISMDSRAADQDMEI